jgi:hypothetical protein
VTSPDDFPARGVEASRPPQAVKVFEQGNCHPSGRAEGLAGGTGRERLQELGKNPHRTRRRVRKEHNLPWQAQDAPGARCGCEFSRAEAEGREVVPFGSVERVDG